MRYLRWMRYLLVWPAISAYRRRARRSLRWRLAGYNLATLIVGLAAALTLVGLLTAFGFARRDYAAEEPADDARAVAEFLEALGAWQGGAEPALEPLGGLIAALASGDVPLYREPGQSQFDLRPRQFLRGVEVIALVTADGTPLVASAQWDGGDGSTGQVFSHAALGSRDLRENSILRERAGSEGTGAYPIFDGERVAAVVLIEKSEIQAPQGGAIFRAELRHVLASVWIGSVVAIIPGLALAALLAVFAARSVARPVGELSSAAKELAAGNLDQRVEVRGEDEVASLAASFNTMAGQLQSTLDSLSIERERALGLLDANRQLVANVSHELRTPVALVRGQLEALDEESPGSTRVEMALRETGRLESMVGDLFQLASADANTLSVELAEHDTSAVVREAIEPLRDPAWRESEVSLVIETPPGTHPALMDRERLIRVLQNLARNAIRHTPPGGLVRVDLQPGDSTMAIEVADTGPGIPPDDVPHVFERFYRGDAGRSRETGGAGLGLAIAKEFVEAMGGSIAVQSEPGEGATFTVVLPRSMPDVS
jgi:two-component system OmpR family sensor kinase/two-component system sensor histidine kinase BaeS